MSSESVVSPPPIERSITSVLNVGACIVFFSVSANAAKIVFPFLSPDTQALLHGLFEISGGIQAMACSNFPERTRLILSSALCGFGGLSLIAQNHLFLRQLGIKTHSLILFGMIRGLFSALAMMLLL